MSKVHPSKSELGPLCRAVRRLFQGMGDVVELCQTTSACNSNVFSRPTISMERSTRVPGWIAKAVAMNAPLSRSRSAASGNDGLLFGYCKQEPSAELIGNVMQQRRHPRVGPLVIRTTFRIRETSDEGYLTSLSEGGAFLCTEEPISFEEKLTLRFTLPWEIEAPHCGFPTTFPGGKTQQLVSQVFLRAPLKLVRSIGGRSTL